MSRVVRFLVVILAVYGINAWQNRGYLFGGRNPASLSADTCGGKQICAIIYMAPWCPACRSEIPFVQNALHRSLSTRNTGLRVIVGMGKPDENQTMASAIARDVKIDDNRAIAEKMAIKQFPTFRVVDKEGMQIAEGDEAYQWVVEKFGR